MEEVSSRNWDFEAPCYMDFNSNTGRLDDGADKFFDVKMAEMDQASSDETDTSQSPSNVPPQRVVVENEADDHPEELTDPINDVGDKENVPEFASEAQVKSEEDVGMATKVPSNIITPSRIASWNKSVPSKNRSKTKPAPPVKTAKPKRSASQRLTALSKTRERGARRSVQTNYEPAIKKTKLNCATPVLRHKTVNSANFATPNVLDRQAQTSNQLHRSRTGEQRKVDEPTPAVQTKITVVKEFHFATDKRLKSHPMKTRCEGEIKANDFTKGLRSYPETSKRGLQPQVTQVQPFKLSEGKKRKLDESGPPFGPALTMKNKFKTKGPMKVPRITQPVAPKLSCMLRNRPVSAISEIEKEEKELEEIKRNKIKSHPIKAKLFDGPEVLKKVEKKPATIPVEFNLYKPKKTAAKSDETLPVPFKAKPCPSFEKITRVKEKPKVFVTQPNSPAFALKDRIKPKTVEPETFEMKSYYKPVPAFTSVRPVCNKKAPTKSVPFSFAERDRKKQAELQAKIKEIKENETKITPFKANGMPILESPIALPRKAMVTKPITPKFQTEDRATIRVAKSTDEVDKDVSVSRKASFKARPMPNPQSKWEPKKLNKASTVPLDVQLASERRARERHEFKKKRTEMEEQSEAMQKEIDLANQKREEIEIFELRRKMVIKANPIPVVGEFVVTASSKPCTVPMSPNFSDRFTK